MKQSRLMSLMEAAANVVVGYSVAVLTQLAVFPWFGLPARVTDALGIGAVMTGVSVVRTFALRRLFEALRAWGGDPAVASTVHLGNPSVRLALGCGKIVREQDRQLLRAHFEKNAWLLWDDEWLKERLRSMSRGGYENSPVAVVSKLLRRG